MERIIKESLKKIKELRKLGINPYPSRVPRSFSILQAVEKFEKLKKEKKNISLAGRVIAWRQVGKISFAKIQDESGQIQVIFKNEITKDYHLTSYIVLGDIIFATGFLDFSQTNEKSLFAKKFGWGAKVIRPLPKEYYKIKDEEILSTKKYLLTLLWPEERNPYYLRAKIYKKLREFLEKNKFTEVETPILQTHYGGALARPFKTYLEALKIPLYLRISPEIYLKKMLVGGFERIYEIGKDFRNEGIDREHNPEFSMIELYVAWKDLKWLIPFTERLIKYLVKSIYPDLKIKYQEKEIDLNKKWRIVDYCKMIKDSTGLDYFNSSLEEIENFAKKNQITVKAKIITKGKLIDEIFKKLIRPNLIEPTFLINHPVEISPLAKSYFKNPLITERMQLYLAGFEIANGFSELNDPKEQEKRLREHQKLLKKGELESHPYDKTFIEALEYGMPPTAGLGIGLDRLITILANKKSLRNVIYFPFIKKD